MSPDDRDLRAVVDQAVLDELDQPPRDRVDVGLERGGRRQDRHSNGRREPPKHLFMDLAAASRDFARSEQDDRPDRGTPFRRPRLLHGVTVAAAAGQRRPPRFRPNANPGSTIGGGRWLSSPTPLELTLSRPRRSLSCPSPTPRTLGRKHVGLSWIKGRLVGDGRVSAGGFSDTRLAVADRGRRR